MIVRVKICGITNLEDALAAVEAGADALGFMFFKGSPRTINAALVRTVVRKLPPFVARVGVFVNASRTEVLETIQETRIDTLQFHGEESDEFCASFALPVIKAFRIKDQESVSKLSRYKISAALLDAYVPGQLGGTGARFNWELAVRAKESGRKIILAGGLTPENVQDAIAKVQPYGVDVSSGVESAPGKKDHGKIKDFITQAKST